ncbi:hypothetical protein [Nocardia sp. XZ_19_369]|uniref:hypothetical protein n=1 Tax=Nocardia sp. XZ_19_369 TaxID=2769487 RepID=UPI00188EFA01|nr:hypothetical protein [Nocardia sp. XZ_19_369]
MLIGADQDRDVDPDERGGQYRRVAGSVRALYDRDVRATATVTVSAGIVFIVLSIFIGWVRFLSGPESPNDSATPTISVSSGAGILGVFAALIIGLNVAAWSIRASNPPGRGDGSEEADEAELAARAGLYARYLMLSQAAQVCSYSAVLVGIASLVAGVYSGEILGGFAVFGAGSVIAVLSIDTSAGLVEGPEIRSEVRLHRVAEDYRRVHRLLGSPSEHGPANGRAAWSEHRAAGGWTRRGTVGRTGWLLCDFALTVVLTAAGPLVAAAAVRGADWTDAGSSYLKLILMATLAVVVVGGGVALIVVDIVERQFVLAILIGLLLLVIVLLWCLSLLESIVGSDVSGLGKIGISLAFLSFSIMPLLLSANGLRTSNALWMPGGWVRWLVRRRLHSWSKSMRRQMDPQAEGASELPDDDIQPPTGNRFQRFRRYPQYWIRKRVRAVPVWYRQVSGLPGAG